MIVSDDNVFPLYGKPLCDSLSGYECHSLVLPHGEPTKSFDTLPKVYSAMLDAKLTRSDLVIALGGGVIGDLTGICGIYLLARNQMCANTDFSFGTGRLIRRGKTAVDLPQGKNLVGAFFHPKMVLIDPLVLNTLPDHFIHDGMGEVIKYGCIKDSGLFDLLLSHSSFEDLKPDLPKIIARCVDIKRIVVEADQFDTGERMLLNFGHTLAHTIEQYYQYERESHGEAVGIGMYQLTKMSEKRGLTAKGCAEKIRKALDIYNLPTSCKLTVSELIKAISLDKKNLNGHLNLVLLKENRRQLYLSYKNRFF